MARHQVFLVNGMGSFAKDWSLDAQQTLTDAFNQYKLVKQFGLTNQFEFVEITYNDIFEELRAQWRANATAASTALVVTGLADVAANRLVQLANGATGEDFWRTHVLDVVLYRFMKPIAERINQSVRLQILSRLQAFPPNDVPSWSVIGHSLGTAVVNDTLHAMFTQPVDGVLLGDRFKPDFVFMVANVAKLLWNRGGDFYSSRVRPHTVDSLGMCWRYCTFRHELDPFARIDAFNPPVHWFPEGLVPAQRETFFQDVRIGATDVRDINVHGLNHYLSHPAVNSVIINTLAGFEAVRATDVNEALRAWRARRLSGVALSAARADLTALGVAMPQNWHRIIEVLWLFRTLVKNRSALAEGEE
jgi:hypothetical protein